jgi:hypothetical protein
MHLVVKGRFTSYDDLPRAQLPASAHVFDEPDTLQGVARASMPYLAGSLAAVAVLLVLGIFTGATPRLRIVGMGTLVALVATVPAIFGHELVHAVCFPRDATVELWWSLRDGVLFVTSTCPLTRARFIALSLAPNIVFGLAPMAAWLLVPMPSAAATALFAFGAIMFTSGAGDYLNVANALRQVPAGAMVQLSGVHTYWYRRSDG